MVVVWLMHNWHHIFFQLAFKLLDRMPVGTPTLWQKSSNAFGASFSDFIPRDLVRKLLHHVKCWAQVDPSTAEDSAKNVSVA